MATRMQMAELELVDADHPDAQRIAVLEAPRQMALAHAKIPEPGPDELRIKIKWVGICGSDLEAYRGDRKPEFLSFPARLGHEVGGIVDAVGPEVHGVRVGDRVACRYVWGAFAEYIVCRPFNVKVVPPEFPLDATSPIEVLPGIIHAAELARADARTNVLVMGQGVSGLILTQVLKLFSPKTLAVTDLHEKNLELARRYGATHTYQLPSEDARTLDFAGSDFPDGFDVVVPCLLSGDGVVDAIDATALCGRIVLYGCIGTCHKPVDFFKMHRKRLELYTTEPRRDIDMRRYLEEGMQLVVEGLVNTREMVTHRVPLSEIQRAFELRDANDGNAIHVLVDCEA